jgi:hypothetical protein
LKLKELLCFAPLNKGACSAIGRSTCRARRFASALAVVSAADAALKTAGNGFGFGG